MKYNILVDNGKPYEIAVKNEKELKKHPETKKEIRRGRGELILVVDDEESIREITKAMLENSGYKVATACDGAEGLAAYTKQQGQIKLVIMDMMMPILDGRQSIRALRKIDPDVKIIAVSGLASTGKTEAALEEDVFASLRKPYSSDVLLQKIAEALV